MYIDAKLLFSRDQVLAGDAPSTNTLDFTDPRRIGVGENLYIVVVAKTALTGTLQVNLESDDDDSFPSAVVRDIGSFVVTAPAGTALVYRINPADMVEQYARLDLNNATGGTVDAFITHCIDDAFSYASGFTITT